MVVDRVLVDGIQTIVWFHIPHPPPLTNSRPPFMSFPFITLYDDHRRSYQQQGGGMSGGQIVEPGGTFGLLWQLIDAFAPRQTPRGYLSFPSLVPAAHAAILRISYAGAIEVVRVPMHLGALSTVARTVRLRLGVARRRLAHGYLHPTRWHGGGAQSRPERRGRPGNPDVG